MGEVEVGELNAPSPTGVEDSRAIRVVLPLEVRGQSLRFFIEAAVMRRGDALTEVNTTGISAPPDPALRDRLVQLVADRMSE